MPNLTHPGLKETKPLFSDSSPGKLFVITPCFNEAQALPHFLALLFSTLHTALQQNLVSAATVLCVDDGSTDQTWRVLSEFSPPPSITLQGLRFSRNFGHQAALCAGLEELWKSQQCGPHDTVILMDSDGQHPPDYIFDLLQGRSQGFHQVQMRRTNSGAGFWKGLTSRLYYKIFRILSGLRLESGCSDFRAFSGRFLAAYIQLPETAKFNRGLFQWLGFKTLTVPYRAHSREHGESKYSLKRMLKLGATGVTYFSSRPLVLTLMTTTLLGFSICGAYVLFEFVRILNGAAFVPGWPTVLFVITLWGSLLSLGQLLTAIYIARIFDEVKGRPAYIVEGRIGLEPLSHPAAALRNSSNDYPESTVRRAGGES